MYYLRDYLHICCIYYEWTISWEEHLDHILVKKSTGEKINNSYYRQSYLQKHSGISEKFFVCSLQDFIYFIKTKDIPE